MTSLFTPSPQHPSLCLPWRRALVWAIAGSCSVCGVTAAQNLPPHQGPGGSGEWSAHHVRLTGTGLDKALAQVWNLTAQQCKDAGHPVADATGGSPGAGPIQQLTYDLYYTAHSVTTYKTSDILQLRPDCTTARQTRQEVEVLTREGLCNISPLRRVQRGPCRLPDPSAAPATWPSSTAASPANASGTQQWAGHSCQLFEERWAGLNTRYCLLTPSASFTPMPASWHRQHSGVLLQLTTWSDADPSLKVLDLKATQVQTGLRVSSQVLLPLVKPANLATGAQDHAR